MPHTQPYRTAAQQQQQQKICQFFANRVGILNKLIAVVAYYFFLSRRFLRIALRFCPNAQKKSKSTVSNVCALARHYVLCVQHCNHLSMHVSNTITVCILCVCVFFNAILQMMSILCVNVTFVLWFSYFIQLKCYFAQPFLLVKRFHFIHSR